MIGRHRFPFEHCFVTAESESRNAKFKAERRSKAAQKTQLGRMLRKIGIR